MITAITITAVCAAALVIATVLLIRAGLTGRRGIVWIKEDL